MFFGVIITLLCFWIIRKAFNSEEHYHYQNFTPSIFVNDYGRGLLDSNFTSEEARIAYKIIFEDPIKRIDSVHNKIVNNSEVFNQKIETVNTRFNDLYALGGVILGLLVVAYFGVTSKAKSVTEEFVDQNFDKYRQEIEGHLIEAKDNMNQIQIITELLESKNSNDNKQEVSNAEN